MLDVATTKLANGYKVSKFVCLAAIANIVAAKCYVSNDC